MEPLVSSQFGRSDMVELSTRYFTSRRDDPHGIATPFDKSIDQNGILSSMSNDKYFRGEDNKVHYYALEQGDEESSR